MLNKFRGEINLTYSNQAEEWNKWVQKFDSYLTAFEKNEKDQVKIAILLNLLDDNEVEIFNKFKSEDKGKLKDLNFFSGSQKDGQQIDNYMTESKTLESACEFGNPEEGLIRDHLVLGIREKS
ncbi:uncharacterized protein TNCT_732071 [Trichonephila clavata]|uniref:Uncharacterized protein n=1 Tax=Trichonephila clavata TaxID=2740835 RepID=A0A8X6HE65_TRICU|nr:uncharacterized protein TNCT_732071 [Trichonephila clavata]